MGATKDILARLHPHVEAQLDVWEFYARSYEGGDAYRLGQYLWRHTLEFDADYASRLSQAVYRNFCGPVIDTWLGFIRTAGITRTSEVERVAEWWGNVDRDRTPIGKFVFDSVAPAVQSLGTCFVLVDTERLAGETTTRADRLGLRPYLRSFRPTQVVSYELDRYGALEWIRFAVDGTPHAGPWDKRPDAVIHYETWTRSEWAIHSDEAVGLGGGIHNLGVVPVVPIINQPSKHYAMWGESALADLADLNRDHYNLESEIRSFIRGQCFPLLVLDAQDVEGRREIAVGRGNYITARSDGFAPTYLTPPTGPSEFIRSERDARREQILETASIRNERAETIQPSSGIAEAYKFHSTNQDLADKALRLQDGEAEILRLVGLWWGLSPDEPIGTVTYPREFEPDDVNGALRLVVEAVDAGLPPTAIREMTRRAVRAVLGDDHEQLDAIDAEIEMQTTRTDSVFSTATQGD